MLFWSMTYLGFQSGTEGLLVLKGNHCVFCLFVCFICVGDIYFPYLITETHMKPSSCQSHKKKTFFNR